MEGGVGPESNRCIRIASLAAPPVFCSATVRLTDRSPSSFSLSLADVSSGVEETDPERVFKLKECCDLLLAGGYFRARIPTLSSFDKVVGGMVWSITASGVDVDVDIIFQENATIGQRIKLSDQLVKAMVKMQSPHPLQAHQIQGLDYDHLFPVLQWLVRKVIEHRRLTGDLIRAQSLSNFSKSYRLPTDPVSTSAVVVRPARKFRKKLGSTFDSASARTDATLLEYGEHILSLAATAEDEEKEAKAAERTARGGGRTSLIGKFEQSGATNAEKDAAARADLERREQARLEALRNQLDDAGLATRISGQNVGQLVGLQAAEIAKAAADYEDSLKRAEEAADDSTNTTGGVTSKRGQEAAFARQVDAMKRKIAAAREAAEKKTAAAVEAEAKQAELQARANKEERRINKIHTETAKLESLESNAANKEILSQLRSLVSLNESLKAQESAFKESCGAQRREYKEQLARLDPTSASSADDEESSRLKAVESLHAKELETLNKLRRVLAKKNQEIAVTRRRIDEVPTRAELLQFQRRFVELYELSSAKHVETKKFFSMYNTLHASHEFITTEVRLLNSIIDGFPAAVTRGSPESREEFIAKFEQILAGVASNREHVQGEIDETSLRRETLLRKYMAAVDAQRAYVKLRKEFKEESTKNEKLSELKEELDQRAAQAAQE